uniref:DEP domain-containing protein n=1 Tax=Meloidogyne hapla TaxID=6305 RepID=A0A1I8BB62_MELHA
MGTTLNYTINKIQQLNNSLPLQQTETTLPTTSIEQEPPPVLEPETNNSVQVSDAIADAFSFASNIISNKTTKPSNFSLKVLDKRLLPSTPNGFLLWSADYKRQNHKGNLDFSGHSEMQKIKNKTQNILKESLSQPNQIGNNTLITENNLQESSSQQMINEENEQHQNNNPLETPDKYLLKKVPNKQNSSTSDNNYKNEVKNLNCFVAQMLLSQYRDGKLTTSEQLLNELTNAGIFITKKQYLVPLYSSPNEGQFFLIGSDQEWRKFKATNYLSKHFLHELDCLKCLKLRRKERSNTWGQLGKAVLRFGELDDNIPILHHQNCTGESLEYLHKLHYSPNIAPEIISPQLEENARERVSVGFEVFF